MTRAKKNTKYLHTLPVIAQNFADQLIAGCGIKDAEQVAKLCYEKVVASRKGLERRYGKRK